MKRRGVMTKWGAAFLISLAVLLIGAAAFAADDQDAVATNFLKFLRSDKQILRSEIVAGNRLDAALPPIPVGHLYHLEGGGYLLIATSTSLTPVKAYSLSSNFDALPPNYRIALLDEMEAQSRTAPLIEGRSAQAVTVTENAQRWNFLLNLDSARLPLEYLQNTWLIQTKWNQGYPYNKFTPQVSGQSTWTGCVNTALAQVLRYHKYPVASKGVASYIWNGQTLKAILYRTYNWDNMPEVLDAATPDYQVDEAARLIGDLGIANYTNFGLSSSSASLRDSVLIDNFGYSNGLQRMNNSSVDAFFTTLKTEIDAERPVLLLFPGHMVVADGYKSDGAGRNIHINMGWGGSYDNFYFLDQTVLPGDKDFITAPGSLDIYYNIKPCSPNAGDCARDQESADIISDLNISGDFNYAADADRYTVYLRGSTTLTASRGYSNIAFRMTLDDAAGNNAWTFDGSENSSPVVHSQSLPTGKYTLEVSLGVYTFSETNNHYTIALTTGSITPEEKAAIDLSIDIPPVINNAFKDILLNSANPSTYRILIDARDENGDAVALEIFNGNTNAFQTALNGNILEITPVAGASKIGGGITVKATANGKTAERSFFVMVSNEDVSFGKTFEVTGLFENQTDFNLHKVILDGACTITGYNGYSNQAYYSSVQDNSGGAFVEAGNTTISRDFGQNHLYQLGASLEQNPGGYGYSYTYDAGKNDRYVLSVSCPNADESTCVIAGLLGISLDNAAPTITFPAIFTKTYGAADFDPGATASSCLAVTYASSNPAVATIVSGKIHIVGAGTSTITASQSGAASLEQTLTVNKAVLTITADNKSRAYNTANPTLTYTASGFVNGETILALSGTPTLTTTATTASPAGSYPITITAGTLTATNYSFSLVNGALSIRPPGDVNNDGNVDLRDAILSLKICGGISVSEQTITLGADVNNDGKIGIAEVMYILQSLAGLRSGAATESSASKIFLSSGGSL